MRKFRSVFAFIFILLLSPGFGSPKIAEAATYTFTQTNWSGSADTPGSPTILLNGPNNTGATSFATSSSNITRSATAVTTQFATGSITQTDDTTSVTGFNYTGKTFTSTTISGTGSAAKIILGTALYPKADMVRGNQGGLFAYYANSAGTFGSGSFFGPDAGSQTNPELVDIDNDGDLDIIYSISTQNPNIGVLENQGTAQSSNFVSVTTLSKLGSVAANYDMNVLESKVGVGDVNHDGLFDIVIGKNGGQLDLLLNVGTLGSPSFSLTTFWLNAFDFGTGIDPSFADINRDGWDDLILGESTGKLNVYYNTKNTATVHTLFSTTPSLANWLCGTGQICDVGSDSSIDFGDINGDGDTLDLAVGNNGGSGGGYVYFYLHTSSTHTWASSQNLSINDYPLAPALGDLNNDLNYYGNGSYTSGVLDTGQAATFSTVSFVSSTPANTQLSIQLRAGNVATVDGTWTGWQALSGSGATVPVGLNSATHRYVQYQAIATTTNALVTPSLDSITINYGWQRNDYLISNIFDASSTYNFLTSLTWNESPSSNNAVAVSLRSSSTSAWLNSAATSTAWVDFTSSTAGRTLTTSTLGGTTTSISIAAISSLRTGNDDRFFQYKFSFTTNSTSTPTISYMRVGFAVNAAPGVSIANAYQSTSTDSTWGKVYTTYTVTDTDTPAPRVTSTLQYSTGTAWSTFGTVANTVSYTTTTIWLATTTVPNTYASAMQIRVTVNDGESVNATTTATSSAFEFDSKRPTISTFQLNSQTDRLTISSSDNTTTTMHFYDSVTDTGWIAATTSRAWTPVLSSDNTELVNLQVRDYYGNISTSSAKAPAAPAGVTITDTSTGGTWSERINWTAYTTATSGVAFSKYQVYRATSSGGTYSQIGVDIVDSAINFYVDSGLSTTTTYYYKVAVIDSDGDASNFSSIVYDQPDAGTSVQFSSASATGGEGTSAVTVLIALSGVSMSPVTVNYAVVTASSTATGGGVDYTFTNGTATIAAGATSTSVALTIANDEIYEGDETVVLALTSPSGATLGTNTSYTYTITDSSSPPAVTFSTSSSNINEGFSGTFSVRLSAASGVTTTVPFTVSSTATNYTITPSPVVISPSATSSTITITTTDNNTYTGNKTVIATMGTPINANAGSPAVHTATIIEATQTPVLSIGNASQNEGNSGTSTMSFTVSLTDASAQTITVDYTTADGTATAGSDYTAATGTLTFSPGQTSKTVSITIFGDTIYEGNETFTVTLSNASPTSTPISTAIGTGTILNDETISTIQFNGVNISNSETTTSYSIPLVLSPASGSTVTVSYATSGTAVPTTDYTLTTASPVSISAGATTSSINLTIVDDSLYSGDRTLALTLSSPSSNAQLGASTTFSYTIQDDETMPQATISSASTTEGNSGTTTLTFPVILSGGSRSTTTVAYATANGTATAGSDYTAATGTLTFSPGQTSQSINVTIIGDIHYESDETFAVTLSSPSGITIAQGTATGTIVNDDSQPSLAINDVVATTEGNSGTSQMTFTVTLSGTTSGTTTVAFTTVDGTATVANNDYTANSGTLTFSSGQTTKTIDVTIAGDTTYEADEVFNVVLSNPSGAVLGDDTGLGTITNDDTAPTIQFGVQSSNGRESSTTVSVAVSLSAPSSQNITVSFAATGGTATVVDDYSLASSSITIPAGSSQGTFTLTVVNDELQEPDETVILTLSSPINATLGSVQTYTYTIVNDDVISAVTISSVYSTIAKVTWTTTLAGTTVVQYGLSIDNLNLTKSYNDSVTSHIAYLANLSPGTTYYLKVISVDTTGATNTDDNHSAGYTFTTNNGAVITGVGSANVRDVTADITWTTSKAATAGVFYSTTSSLANSTEVSTTTIPQENYTQTIYLTGLTPQTTYFYKVRSIDTDGNIAEEWNSGAYYSLTTTADQTPPVISNIQTPVRTLDSIVVTWQTNEGATGIVNYGTSTGSYPSSTTLDSSLSTTHSAVLLNLTGNITYYYTITSADTLGNSTTTAEQTADTTVTSNIEYIHTGSGGVSAEVYSLLQDELKKLQDQYQKVAGLDDTTPPVIESVRSEDVKAFTASVKWKTNEPATSFLEYGETAAYGLTAGSPELVMDHAFGLKSLKLGTTYHFRAISADKAGNRATSNDYTFTTQFAAEAAEDLVRTGDIEQFQDKLEKIIESMTPSLVPPIILEVKVASTTETSAVVTWRTNIDSTSIVALAEGEKYKADTTNPYTSEFVKTGEKSKTHAVELQDLKVGATYHFQVKSQNVLGVAGKGKDMIFSTKFGKPDLVIANVGQVQANIKWTTDRKTTSYAEYKEVKTGKIMRAGDDILTGVHILQLGGLAQDTTYEVRGYGTDERENTLETVTRRFRTLIDTKPPTVSGVKIENAIMPNRTDRLQTIVFWKTDEPATSQISYQEGIGQGNVLSQQSVLDTDLVTDHAVILTTFKPSTVYRVQVTSKDASGNVGTSKIQSILTPQKGESIIDIISRNFEQSFQWLKQLR
ncbi:MAG: Calx-beta domain-containing protein [Patescibacteria group bacterium]